MRIHKNGGSFMARRKGSDHLKNTTQPFRNKEFSIVKCEGDTGDTTSHSTTSRRRNQGGWHEQYPPRITVLVHGTTHGEWVDKDGDGAITAVVDRVRGDWISSYHNDADPNMYDKVVTQTCTSDGTVWYCSMFKGYDMYWPSISIFDLNAGEEITFEDPQPGYNSFLCVLEGKVLIGAQPRNAPLAIELAEIDIPKKKKVMANYPGTIGFTCQVAPRPIATEYPKLLPSDADMA